MYLQYCVRKCVIMMSALEILGIIRLTYRQAENRRVKSAVLCLKYILSLAATFACVRFCLTADGTALQTAIALCASAAALIAVLFRGMMLREMYLLSQSFLRISDDGIVPTPGLFPLLFGELAYLSAIWTVFAVMLSPAYFCLRYGIHYYSLSADRRGFMLLLASSMLLTAGGTIFASVTAARLSCAEYLWMSGKCTGMPSALDSSWELTRGSCGDMLMLKSLSLFCGITVSARCKFNLSHKLFRQKGLPSADGPILELVQDSQGEQHWEIG